jgi:hypothetical protein
MPSSPATVIVPPQWGSLLLQTQCLHQCRPWHQAQKQQVRSARKARARKLIAPSVDLPPHMTHNTKRWQLQRGEARWQML